MKLYLIVESGPEGIVELRRPTQDEQQAVTWLNSIRERIRAAKKSRAETTEEEWDEMWQNEQIDWDWWRWGDHGTANDFGILMWDESDGKFVDYEKAK